MKFIDEVQIKVKAGDGGRGCVSFRREKFVPRGGPNGGNGAPGGDIVLEADSQLTTLLDLKMQREYRAGRGEHGRGKNQHGKRGEDRNIRVPVGTVVKDSESGEIVAVNIGFAPDPPPNAPAGEVRNQKIVIRYPLQLTGYFRFPEPAGTFTPAGNVGQRLWFVRDHPAMARALGWDGEGRTVAPFYVDLESPALLDGVKPGPLRVRLKDDHLQYSITWFGLAAVMLIAFGFWLRTQRRG